MATGDVWKVELELAWGTVQCRPGFHLIEGSGGGGLSPQGNVADAVDAALGGDPLAGFSDQLDLSGIIIHDAQPGLLPSYRQATTAISGDVVDVNPLPPQSAGVISLKTDLKPVTGAFAAAGRIYMPGIPQNGQISGFLQAGFQAALSAFFSLLFGPFVTDGTAYQMHIVSYTPNSKPRTVRAVQPVTGFSINNVVRSQRRREFGVGI